MPVHPARILVADDQTDILLALRLLLKDAGFDRRYLPLGGVLSGFFGGLSGHQGALRSAFLIRCGLSQEAFVATGIVAACLVDLARLAVYARHLASLDLSG